MSQLGGAGAGAGTPVTLVEGSAVCASIRGWAQQQRTNWFEELWHLAIQGVALLIAKHLMDRRAEITEMQMNLADMWYDYEEYKWRRFRDAYIPHEINMLHEVDDEPLYRMNCVNAQQRGESSASSAMDTALGKYSRILARYRSATDLDLGKRFDYRRSIMQDDTINYNLQDERWFEDLRNDRRWNRRSAVLNLGRNVSEKVLQYGQAANSLANRAGSRYDQLGASVMQAAGYIGSRMSWQPPLTTLSNYGNFGVEAQANIPLGFNYS